MKKISSTVILDSESMSELDQVREQMIQPIMGVHDRSQAIRFCIKYAFTHGVNKEVTA